MGELLGKQLEARYVARLCYGQGWREAQELVTAVMVFSAESQLFTRAYNDNKDANGNVLSRDCGICQINITSRLIGSQVEEDLYDPAKCVAAAWDLYDRRGFQPWVAFTTRIYLRDTYMKRAGRGVANFLAETKLGLQTDEYSGAPYVHKLTSPVFDYEYRVVGLANAVRALKGTLATAQAKRDWSLVQAAKVSAANATLIPKQ